jgi:anti-sigma regulatory factor (Ser/Thr protein kinase)
MPGFVRRKKNDLSAIERLGRELKLFGEHCGLSEKTLLELNLVLEEIIANVISCAYDDNRLTWIASTAAYRQGEVRWKLKRRKEARLKSSACAAG